MNLKLTYGQHVLFGFTMTSLTARSNRNYTVDETIEIAELVYELTDLNHYNDDPLQCPDIQIMTNPEKSFTIFEHWIEENETYFSEYLRKEE